MSQVLETQRHRRGDPSPVDASLVFFRYKEGREVWVTKETLEHKTKLKRSVQAKQRAKPSHKEKMKLYFREYNKRPHQKAYHSAYYKQPEVRAKVREQYASDPEMRKKRAAYSRSPKGKEVEKKSRAKRKDWFRDYNRRNYSKRMSIPTNRIAANCRSRMRAAVTCAGTRKASKSKDLLGCSFEFFRGWIEGQFVRGMSWENYGTFWEIDHERPVCSFSLTDPEEQRKAFHYTNCRPLWSDLNRAKGGKIIPIAAAA